MARTDRHICSQAKKLGEVLKGCSIYVVGLGQRKVMVSQVLARRLPRYRCYDVSSIMCSTYASLAGGDTAVPTLPELVSAEPLADVEQLSRAVTRELQQMTRSVFVAWDGAFAQSYYMVMQQGIVVHLDFEVCSSSAAVPGPCVLLACERSPVLISCLSCGPHAYRLQRMRLRSLPTAP